MSILQKFPCRVCGFEFESDVWGGDENTSFSYDICECCACEAGVNDFSLEVVRSYRKKWIAEGCFWFQPNARPQNWNMDEQFSKIPKRWT
jgi:hypothetical protein